MRLFLATSSILKIRKIISSSNRIIMVCVITIFSTPTPTCGVDNLGLLMGTLMTHKQISCIDQPVAIRCPSTTNVIIEVAKYVSFVRNKESNICDISDFVKNTIDEHQLKNCQWHKSLQYSLLQTAVENCRSKEQCHFQMTSSKSGINPCPDTPAYIEVKYQCRPSSFNSKIGCEYGTVQFQCETNTRLAIFSASYGRTQYQSVQCPQPQGVAEETCLLSYATEIVINQCHGKRNCTLVADSSTFSNPCQEKSRVYLKVVYACVPRGVLLQKYEESPDSDETVLQEEVDQRDVLDNPESLAPYLDVTNKRKYNENNSSAILSQHTPSNGVYNFTDNEGKEKLYIYLIGSVSGIVVSLVIFIIVRLVWKKRASRSDDKYRENSTGNTSLPHTFNDEISEADADITLPEVVAPVTVILGHHHISSPSEVIKYGKDEITPKSLYQEDNTQFYYG